MAKIAFYSVRATLHGTNFILGNIKPLGFLQYSNFVPRLSLPLFYWLIQLKHDFKPRSLKVNWTGLFDGWWLNLDDGLTDNFSEWRLIIWNLGANLAVIYNKTIRYIRAYLNDPTSPMVFALKMRFISCARAMYNIDWLKNKIVSNNIKKAPIKWPLLPSFLNRKLSEGKIYQLVTWTTSLNYCGSFQK